MWIYTQIDLEIIRKFLSPSVSRIHGNEDGASWVKCELSSFKHELLDALSNCRLYAVDLLCDHRQNFQLDTVKLVETCPRTSLSKTLEELAHCFVVQAVRTVEHHTLANSQTIQKLSRCRYHCYYYHNYHTLAKQHHWWAHLSSYITRGSAIAEKPRDALRQLKYYGRFLTELLTRSSANPEELCEHTVSWNRVQCCTNVRRIACENVCNRWITFKVIQGHCRCHHLIGHILFPISLPL